MATKKDSISIVWHIEDVRSLIEGTDIKLTDDECMEILEAVDNEHDATIGVNWDTIQYHIDEFIREKNRV